MDWAQVVTIIAANLGAFFWARSESRADQAEIRLLIKAIQDEMKDFHGRLCAIEERNKNK